MALDLSKSKTLRISLLYTFNNFFFFWLSVEDLKICKCLILVGGIAQETRDKEGKETFVVLDINHVIHAHFPDWYITYHHKRGALKVCNSLSTMIFIQYSF